jgi:hypothetical protein
MSSMTANPDATRAGSASVAAASVGNVRSAVPTWVRIGSVRNRASATNPSVPSLPTSRCSRISSGSE